MDKNRYFVLGVLSGIFLLVFWGSLYQPLSMLTPEGPQVYINDVRIKHWYIGVILMVISVFTRNKSDFSYFFLGLGAVFFLDEIDELLTPLS